MELDHPGANDLTYRARRDEIAQAAYDFHKDPSSGIPLINYTDEENKTWQFIAEKQKELHEKFASRAFLEGKELLNITTEMIPELRHLDEKLRGITNFGIIPVPGLIDTDLFLGNLANRIIPCTQYIRHSSKPEYTPEPDIVHEVIGHIPMLTNPDLVEFTVALGNAAKGATSEQIKLIDRAYWFTVEYGLIEEDGELKTYGAGLLSSLGEIGHSVSNSVEHRPFSVDEILASNYIYTQMQKRLFVIPSFESLTSSIDEILTKIRSKEAMLVE